MSDTPTSVGIRLRRIRDRHFDCYVDLASAAEEATDDRVTWFEVLGSEIANIRSALEWGLATERPETAAFAASLHWYWEKSRRFAEGRHVLDRALRHPHLPASARGDALYVAGELAGAQRDLPGSRERYEASRRLAASAGDHYRQARAAIGLGWASRASSLPQPTIEAFTEALELAEHLSTAERASAIRGLAWANNMIGDNDATRQLLREARSILEEAGDPDLTTHYAVETNILVQLGYAEEAMVLADKAIALARAGTGSLIMALLAKDKAADALGDQELLRQAVDEGIELTKAAGEAKWEARFQGRLANHAAMQGDIETARGAVNRGLQLLDGLHDLNLGDVGIRAGLLALRANLAEDDGDLDLAEELHRQVTLGYRDSSPAAHARALAELALLFEAHGNGPGAGVALAQAVEVVERVKHDLSVDLGIYLAILEDDLEQALRLDGTTLDAPWRKGHQGLRSWTRRRAALLAELGRLKESAAVLEEVFEAGGASSEAVDRARSHVDRARVRIALGDADGARSDLRESVGASQSCWATHQLHFATTFARLAWLEGRRDAAVALWSAVQRYRAANKRLPPRLARRFEQPLTELGVAPESPTLDSRAALDELRRLVAEEFEAITATEEPTRP